MFNLPPLPRVFNTRHLTCVACKEKFVAAEGNENNERAIALIMPNVVVHYEDNRRQLPVLPSPYLTQQPSGNEGEARANNSFTEVNCPRCGADNRNWLHLNNYPNKTIFGSLEVWLQRMPGLLHLSAMVAVLWVLMVFLDRMEVLPRAHVVALGIAIPFAVWGSFWDLTRKWKKYREDKYLHSYRLKSWRPALILQLRGLFLIGFFSFIVPLLFISVLPRGFNAALEIIRETPEESVNVALSEAEINTNQQLEDSKSNLEAILAEIQSLLTQLPPGPSPQFEQEIDSLSNKLDTAVNDATTAIEESVAENSEAMTIQREEKMAEVVSTQEAALIDFNEGFLVEKRYLIIWSGLIGAATLITVIISFANLEKFVKRVNAHLPLPIYHSVAGMSRLVSWEAKRALEIKGKHVERIQWTSVNRNEEGGIDLVGLFRDPPAFDSQGQVKSDLIRAQRHTIRTDKWCRVVDAKIEDVMVPIPAGAPAGVMPPPVPHDAPANLRIRLPER